MFPCNFFHPVFRSARGTAGLTECPLPGILSCMKLWSGRGCAEQCVAKLDRAGLYKPKDLVRNTPLVCTLCHKPSLAWGSCHSVCPFKHSIHSLSQWDTSSSKDFHAVRKRVSSFCYCASERFFQHLTVLWLLASISACCLLPLSSTRSAACMAWGQPLTSVILV